MLQVVNNISRALRRVDGRRDWRLAGRIIYWWAAMQVIRVKLARIVAARWLRRRARLLWAHARVLYWTGRQAMHKAAFERREARSARERRRQVEALWRAAGR